MGTLLSSVYFAARRARLSEPPMLSPCNATMPKYIVDTAPVSHFTADLMNLWSCASPIRCVRPPTITAAPPATVSGRMTLLKKPVIVTLKNAIMGCIAPLSVTLPTAASENESTGAAISVNAVNASIVALASATCRINAYDTAAALMPKQRIPTVSPIPSRPPHRISATQEISATPRSDAYAPILSRNAYSTIS